ncbi:MAG: NAD-dependent epimerase/dehydratase family protein [Pseudonocardiaceae bacterium]
MLVTITGGSGTIGTALAIALAADHTPVRSLDLRPPSPPLQGVDFVRIDLPDLSATVDATRGSSVLIHLAAITTNAAFPEVCEHNITATYHVLEAARRNHISRVVLASSHHTIGLTPIGERVTSKTPNRPDSCYAVSKITGEALGSLYAHKHSLTIIALRIGSFHPVPTEPRHAATWLSVRDGVTLLRAAATAPIPERFLTVYGTSDNPQRWWPRDGWDQLGYHPTDTAAAHELPTPITDRWHGGSYATDPESSPQEKHPRRS